MSKCEICGKEGYHKMSCPTQKVTVYLSDEKSDNELAQQVGMNRCKDCGSAYCKCV